MFIYPMAYVTGSHVGEITSSVATSNDYLIPEVANVVYQTSMTVNVRSMYTKSYNFSAHKIWTIMHQYGIF